MMQSFPLNMTSERASGARGAQAAYSSAAVIQVSVWWRFMLVVFGFGGD